MTDRELAGLVALVTGSAKNIGRAIALALARRGAAVVIHARSDRAGAEETAAAIVSAGGRAEVILADISQRDGARRLVAETKERLGRLDIVVNNASIRRQQPLADITEADWREVLGTTLDGSFFVSQAAAPYLAEHGAGALIFIGGIAAHAGVSGRTHAVAAKGALIGMMRGLSVELAPAISVNCVVPGAMDTKRGTSAGGDILPYLPPNLLRRLGRPEDVAAMVLNLALPSGRFVTGQTIHVNGGGYLT